MKSFIQHLKEFAQYSTSDLVFKNNGQGSASSGLNIPISGPMFKRIWPDTIRTTVFHTTDLDGLGKIKRLEGGKKSISAFFSMMSRYMETGVATGGDVHVVLEMEADILVSAKDDVWSQVDNRGRRWVALEWFANAQGRGTGPKFAAVERELNVLIRDLVVKHLTPIMGNKARTEFEYDLWADMKRHLKAGTPAGAKKLSLVIKDYFDGVEKIIKKNSEVMSNILYGYAKGKRQTDNSWDEQIVNNIDITKIHTWESSQGSFPPSWIKKQIANISDWPVKVWDASIEVEIYTRQVAQAEREMMAR